MLGLSRYPGSGGTLRASFAAVLHLSGGRAPGPESQINPCIAQHKFAIELLLFRPSIVSLRTLKQTIRGFHIPFVEYQLCCPLGQAQTDDCVKPWRVSGTVVGSRERVPRHIVVRIRCVHVGNARSSVFRKSLAQTRLRQCQGVNRRETGAQAVVIPHAYLRQLLEVGQLTGEAQQDAGKGHAKDAIVQPQDHDAFVQHSNASW